MRVYLLCVLVLAGACQESPIQTVKAAAVKVVDDPKELTREKAAKLIQSGYGFPVDITLPLRLGSMDRLDWKDWNRALDDAFGGPYSTMERAGMIAVERRHYTQLGRPGITFVVTLSPDGRNFQVGEERTNAWGQPEAIIKVCEGVFGEVTGIRFNESKTEAVAEFVWTASPTNGFGPMIPQRGFGKRLECVDRETRLPGEAKFVLYDDGWRVLKPE